MWRRRRSLTESMGAASRRVQHRAAPAEPAWSCRDRAVSRTGCDATGDNEATSRAVVHLDGVDPARRLHRYEIAADMRRGECGDRCHGAFRIADLIGRASARDRRLTRLPALLVHALAVARVVSGAIEADGSWKAARRRDGGHVANPGIVMPAHGVCASVGRAPSSSTSSGLPTDLRATLASGYSATTPGAIPAAGV